jgi:hypothetical protein
MMELTFPNFILFSGINSIIYFKKTNRNQQFFLNVTSSASPTL